MSDATAIQPASYTDANQFDYTPVPAIAPVAACFGLLAMLAFLGLFGIAIAVLGLLVSLAAWRTIAVSQGQYGGKWLAAMGLLLSLVGIGGGVVSQVQAYNNELPEGYIRKSFNYDLSKPGVEYVRSPDGQVLTQAPASVEALDGKDVFFKGFMYPEQQTTGLKKFLLVKDSGDCCFGGQPAVQDMIGVIFPEDEDGNGMTADYHNQTLVAVAGKFRVRKGVAGGNLEPIYEIDATHFSRAKSSF